MKPDCFVAGFYKCGTTTLYDVLKQHDDVIVSEQKENDFFMDERLYCKGIKWYEDKYYGGISKSEGRTVIEINPHLSGRKGTAKRLRKYYPQNTKILFIMRNPVKMFYSHFRFAMQLGIMPYDDTCYAVKNGFSKAFDRYLRNVPHAYECYENHYSVQLEEYMECFDSNIHCVFMEDMQQNPNSFYKEVFGFFGLRYDNEINYRIHSNETNALPRNVKKLKAYAIFRKLRKSFPECMWEGQNRFLDRIQDNLYDVYDDSVPMGADMSKKTEIKLRRAFDGEKKRIEMILGYKLDEKWW